MKRIAALVAIFGFLALAAPAFARECPARIKDATAAIQKAEQSGSKPADVIKKAKDLVEQAKKEHDSGQHGDSAAHAKEALGLVQ
jgi:hypothetical protein